MMTNKFKLFTGGPREVEKAVVSWLANGEYRKIEHTETTHTLVEGMDYMIISVWYTVSIRH